MMYKLVILFVFILTTNLYSIDTELIDYNFNTNDFLYMDAYYGKVVVIGLMTGYPFAGPVRMFINEEGVWNEEQTNLKDGSPIQVRAIDSQVHFDSTGAIWVSGEALYQYENDNWKEYYIDDSLKQYRRYEKFCIDKFNNIWTQTKVYNKDNNDFKYAELYKFDGKSFKLILRFDYLVSFITRSHTLGRPNNIAALPDGRIVVQRTVHDKEPDFNPNDPGDIYFINQDGTYERTSIITPSGMDFLVYNKAIMDIYYDSPNKIWFPLGSTVWGIDETSGECCSGISLYENNIWYPFNESNGLFLNSTKNYQPINKIIKFKEDGYLLFGRRKIFYMGTDYLLKELSWEDILNKSKYIVCHNYYNGEKGYEYLGKLFDEDINSMMCNISEVRQMPNSDIWINTNKGILVINPNQITSIDESIPTESTFYPNPTQNILNVQSGIQYIRYEIYDLFGCKALHGGLKNTQIEVETLTAGYYFLHLISIDGKIKVKPFIKY